MKTCPSCGFCNNDASDFCENCGSKLAQTPASPQHTAPRPAADRKKLIIAIVVTGACITAALIAVLIVILSGKGASSDSPIVYPTAPTDSTVVDPTAPTDSPDEDDGLEAPTTQLRLLSEYLDKTPVSGHLDKEFYYTEYFDSPLDLKLYDKGYLYYIGFSGYYSSGTTKNTDGSVSYTYVKDGGHTVIIRNGADDAQVSYQNIYTFGLRYNDNGQSIPDPKIKVNHTDNGGGDTPIVIPTTSPVPSPIPSPSPTRSSMCRHCYGIGTCPSCNGSGLVSNPYVLNSKNICTDCGGTGKCSSCHGTGKQ